MNNVTVSAMTPPPNPHAAEAAAVADQIFDKEWRKICIVEPLDISSASGMIYAHYLHKRPAIVSCCLGMYRGITAVGVIVFSEPPKEINKRYGGKTLELSRLWIDDDIPKNAETWFIGKAVKYIKNNFKDIMYLVSYADPSAGHQGTIYKAANWIFDGMTDEGRKTPRCDYRNVITGKKYSRKSHVPGDVKIERVPRVSKYRYKLQIRKYESPIEPASGRI